MEFTAFNGWLLLEFFFSFGIPFAFAHGFYRKHGINKADVGMFCRKSMHVGLVAGLTSFLAFCLLQTFFDIYAKDSGPGDFVGYYGLTTVLYLGTGYLVGFIFIIFEKRENNE